MIKYLSVVTVALLAGCIVYVEPGEESHYHHHEGSPSPILTTVTGDLHAECYEDYHDSYDWYFEMYYPADVETIELYINYWKWVPFERVSGYWAGELNNTYFYCDNEYEFEVVVTDYYGNIAYQVFYW
tara:strand:- start:392 stop:775 length:384 start_codon:yes stop_codon:yes gene_type:complete